MAAPAPAVPGSAAPAAANLNTDTPVGTLDTKTVTPVNKNDCTFETAVKATLIFLGLVGIALGLAFYYAELASVGAAIGTGAVGASFVLGVFLSYICTNLPAKVSATVAPAPTTTSELPVAKPVAPPVTEPTEEEKKQAAQKKLADEAAAAAAAKKAADEEAARRAADEKKGDEKKAEPVKAHPTAPFVKAKFVDFSRDLEAYLAKPGQTLTTLLEPDAEGNTLIHHAAKLGKADVIHALKNKATSEEDSAVVLAASRPNGNTKTPRDLCNEAFPATNPDAAKDKNKTIRDEVNSALDVIIKGKVVDPSSKRK